MSTIIEGASQLEPPPLTAVSFDDMSVPTALDTQVGGSHYKQCAIQPIEYIMKNKLGYCEGAVLKYITRHKSKHGRQDLEKAIHYLEILIENEYPE